MDLFEPDDAIDHAPGLFDLVDIHGIMVEEVESGIIDGYFFLWKGVQGVLIDDLKYRGLNFGAQEQVGLGDGLLAEEFVIFFFPAIGIREIDDESKGKEQRSEQRCEQEG